jgi:hypothetical protein
MKLRLSFKYIITFLLLLIVMMELHEIVHISVGRLLCGCWGPRDFNVWSLCEGCDANQPMSWLATLAGPVFSFTLMWWGTFWLNATHPAKVAVGFSLIFSNIPFGRITTVMMGGGDEMVVLRHFLPLDMARSEKILIGSVILLIVGLPPILKAYWAVNNQRSWQFILGFLTLPLAFLLVYSCCRLDHGNTAIDYSPHGSRHNLSAGT